MKQCQHTWTLVHLHNLAPYRHGATTPEPVAKSPRPNLGPISRWQPLARCRRTARAVAAVTYNLKLTFGDDQDDATDADTELAATPLERSDRPKVCSAADADNPATGGRSSVLRRPLILPTKASIRSQRNPRHARRETGEREGI